ncbi:hypothetical protein [Persicobacter psychrovividus]|uniref:Uncharacterized protein n=1 Tax=Persicobacter psychrovividus TaxID=387638 RepID=A0ABM7VJD8_9BACT|nr:hypothetical protein PEPS_33830 [Persicobacter psychrovividus]
MVGTFLKIAFLCCTVLHIPITNLEQDIPGNSPMANQYSLLSDSPKQQEPKYIKFKIKNNSKERRQFFVKGPKPDGGKFSYGFPMEGFEERDENWTVGTKIYIVQEMGKRKFIRKIEAMDEGNTVPLFVE